MNKELRDRLVHLETLSSMRVSVHKEKGQNVFVFYAGDRHVFATFTYKKAKAFALGVAYGSRSKTS